MSFKNAVQQQQAIEAARMEQAKRTCVAAVYATYPTMLQCEANERQILEMVLAWSQNPDVLPTIELFQSMLDENPDAIKTFATQAIERTKEQIRDEILTLIASKNNGRDGKFDQFNLRSEERRMSTWTLEALRERLSSIKVKQNMAAAPVSVLKSFVADAHRDTSPFPGFATLPSRMVPPGSIHSVEVNAAYLNGLAKTDLWMFKRLVRLYGSSQVDHRRGLSK